MKTVDSARIILVCSMIVAAGGCSSNGQIKTTTDPFGAEQRGFSLYLDPGHYSALSLNEASGKIALDVLVVQRGVSDLKGHPGDKGEFKVGDEIVTFASAADVTPVSNATGYAVFTQWLVRYIITKEEAARFAKAPLVAFKVAVGAQTFQTAVQSAHAKRFQSNVALMTAGSATPAKP